MNLDESLARACEPVPGLLQGALALLPEGLLIGGLGEGGAFDREPLVRSAARCFSGAGFRSLDGGLDSLVEHVFVSRERLVVLSRGQRQPRLVLILVCSAEPNLAFVMNSARQALRSIESLIDLAIWEG